MEGEGVEGATAFLFELVLVVANVGAISIPTYSLTIVRIGFFHRIKQRLHALIIRTFRLDQIDDVEFICCVLSHVLHSEVEPLSVCGGVVIIFENEIVLVLADSVGTFEITRFEATFKYQCCVFVIVFLVICL